MVRVNSFVFPSLGKDIIKVHRIKLPQLGWVKFHQTRPISDGFAIQQARIVRKASGFVWLSLQLDVDVPDVIFYGYPIAIDIGQIVSSRHQKVVRIPRRKFINFLHRQMELLQRRLKHQK